MARQRSINKLEQLEVLAKRSADLGNDSPNKTHAARVNAHIALVAARRGHQGLYRKAAMKVGGYVSRPRSPASKSVFLELAVATAAAGEPEIALEYVRQAAVRGLEGDFVLLAIAEKMIELGRIAAAKEVVQTIRHVIAGVQGWYAISVAEAAAGSEPLSALCLRVEKLPYDTQKAAVLAGVAAGLHSR